ncbi:hypothetical protein [Spirosoma pomorum]
MEQFITDLDGLNRIVFSIGVCRTEIKPEQVTPQAVDNYLRIHLSIRDWVLWLRVCSCLPSHGDQPTPQ